MKNNILKIAFFAATVATAGQATELKPKAQQASISKKFLAETQGVLTSIQRGPILWYAPLTIMLLGRKNFTASNVLLAHGPFFTYMYMKYYDEENEK
jgi:hypothetical protein